MSNRKSENQHTKKSTAITIGEALRCAPYGKPNKRTYTALEPRRGCTAPISPDRNAYRRQQRAAVTNKPHLCGPRPKMAEAMRKRWADPAYRQRVVEAVKRSWATDPTRRDRSKTNNGIPKGMRRAEADAAWALADKLADEAMETLGEKGDILENLDLPNAADDEMGRAALREAYRIAVGPVGTRTKLDAYLMT
jgi:hypothetical protein